MKPLSTSLNSQIKTLAPPFVLLDNAPNSYQELLDKGIDKDGKIIISSKASNTSIYGTPNANYLFRAWHDSLHLKYKKSFSLEDELFIAEKHVSLIKGKYEKNLIWCDTFEQVKYWYKNKKYVDNQRAFVLNQMKTL